jgi:tetratricopeptide (TPR) repeat protein
MKNILILIIWFVSSISLAQSPEVLFSQGNKAYKNGDYQTAVTKYEKALEADRQSAELYYNLANSYYKLNRIAPSIYYYEKALLINPDDEDTTYNLQLANQLKMDKIDRVPENFLLRQKKKITRFFAYNTWAYLSIFWAFVGVFVFGLFLFSKNISTKRMAFAGMFVSLFLLLFSWYNANYARQLQHEKYAIVFNPKTNLMTEPNLSSEKIVTLHEGSKVKVLEKEGDWYLVKLANGKKAWLLTDDIRVIK